MWLINTLVSFIVDLVVNIFKVIVVLFLQGFGLNGEETLNRFVTAFPIADTVWNISFWMGYFVLFTTCLFQIMKSLFGPLTQAEPPTQILAKMILTAVVMAFSNEICFFLFDVGTVPFEFLNDLTMTESFADTLNDFTTNIEGGFSGDFDLSTEVASASATVAVYAVLAAFPEVYFFAIISMLLALLKKFCAMCMEAVERYVILGCLSMFAPLCIACAATKATQKVFSGWLTMMISQVILIFMNSVFLLGFCDGLGYFMTNFISPYGETATEVLSNLFGVGPFLMLMGWCMVGEKVDGYLNVMGLQAAPSGMNMREMGAMFGGITSGKDGGLASKATNKLTGSDFGTKGNFSNPMQALVGGGSGKNKAVASFGGNAKGVSSMGTLGKRAQGNGLSAGQARKAMNNGDKVKGAGIGKGVSEMINRDNMKANAKGFDTTGLGSFTDNCTLNGENGTAHLEFDKNGQKSSMDLKKQEDGSWAITDVNGDPALLKSAGADADTQFKDTVDTGTAQAGFAGSDAYNERTMDVDDADKVNVGLADKDGNQIAEAGNWEIGEDGKVYDGNGNVLQDANGKELTKDDVVPTAYDEDGNELKVSNDIAESLYSKDGEYFVGQEDGLHKADIGSSDDNGAYISGVAENASTIQEAASKAEGANATGDYFKDTDGNMHLADGNVTYNQDENGDFVPAEDGNGQFMATKDASGNKAFVETAKNANGQTPMYTAQASLAGTGMKSVTGGSAVSNVYHPTSGAVDTDTPIYAKGSNNGRMYQVHPSCIGENGTIKPNESGQVLCKAEGSNEWANRELATDSRGAVSTFTASPTIAGMPVGEDGNVSLGNCTVSTNKDNTLTMTDRDTGRQTLYIPNSTNHTDTEGLAQAYGTENVAVGSNGVYVNLGTNQIGKDAARYAENIHAGMPLSGGEAAKMAASYGVSTEGMRDVNVSYSNGSAYVYDGAAKGKVVGTCVSTTPTAGAHKTYNEDGQVFYSTSFTGTMYNDGEELTGLKSIGSDKSAKPFKMNTSSSTNNSYTKYTNSILHSGNSRRNETVNKERRPYSRN